MVVFREKSTREFVAQGSKSSEKATLVELLPCKRNSLDVNFAIEEKENQIYPHFLIKKTL